MKKIILIIAAYFLLPSFGGVGGGCQPHIQDAKRGNTWNSGYNSFGGWIVNGLNISGRTEGYLPPFTMQRFDTNVDLWWACAAISDTTGNLLFYTNGVMVGNKNKNVMLGSDTLNPGFWSSSLSNQGFGYDCFKGVLILPMPNHDSIYQIFHNRRYNSNIANDSLEGSYYTTVNMNRDSGRGAVISLRNPITQNARIAQSINATRHANGRDWWVIVRRCHTDEYLPILLDPTGVHPQGWQSGFLPPNSPFSYNNFTGQDAFSADGSKFAVNNMSAIGNCITLYDFDRCNGRFSNPRLYNWNDSTYAAAGCAFSENSRYLYTNSSKYMLQFDLWRPNPFAQADTIATDDGINGPRFFENVSFGLSQLAANGKIYNTPFGGTVKYYHVINNPNVAGLASNFVQRAIELLTINAESIPNMPYFPLGPLVGSTCDTLYVATTKAPTKSEPSVKVYPNPTTGILNIEIPPNIKGNAYLYNSLGQLIKQMSLSTNTQLKMYDIPNGIYFLSVYATNGRRIGAKRIVVQHE